MANIERADGGVNRGIRGCSEVERKSLLDPHLSVLELLERPDDTRSSEISEEGRMLGAIDTDAGVGATNGSISQSWQTIHQNDDLSSTIPKRCSSQTTAAGILSSSDTSEEEAEVMTSPNAVPLQVHQTPLEKHPTSLQDYHPMNVGMPLVISESNRISDNSKTGNNNEDDDSETITKSLNSSSNSFIMPKLSLSQKVQKFRILVLGRPGLNFYHSIPKKYQNMFELPRSHDPAEFQQYTGILIVFQELKEMVSLLDRVCQCSRIRPVIAVCRPGQRQQVRNLLESLLKNRFVSLLYPPVVANNQSDLLGMFRFLQELSKTVSDNSDMDAEESDTGNKRLKRSLQRKKKKFLEASSGRNGRPRKKGHRRKGVNRWVIWGVSLTLGIGVGYCISHFVSATWISLSANPFDATDSKSINGDLLLFNGSDAKMAKLDAASESPFSHALFLFKQALKQWKLAVKQFIIRNLSSVERMASSLEWSMSEDQTNRILAMGYVML